MPNTTPNRGYPYPTDTDPIDVAGDIQALAEALDTDVNGVAVRAPRYANFVVLGNQSIPDTIPTRVVFSKYDGHASIVANVDGDIRFDAPGIYSIVFNLTIILKAISADLPYVNMSINQYPAAGGAAKFQRSTLTGGSFWTQITHAAALSVVTSGEKLQITVGPQMGGGAATLHASYSFVTVHQVL